MLITLPVSLIIVIFIFAVIGISFFGGFISGLIGALLQRVFRRRQF